MGDPERDLIEDLKEMEGERDAALASMRSTARGTE